MRGAGDEHLAGTGRPFGCSVGIDFLFVVRGRDVRRMGDDAAVRGRGNVVFRDEVDPSEVPCR